MKKLLILALGVIACSANAADLWNQSTTFLTVGGAGLANQEFNDSNTTFSSYMVDDVVVGGGGWNVTSISIWFLASAGVGISGAPTITTARLNTFANSGALPGAGDDPGTTGTGTVVSVVTTLQAGFTNVFKMTASGLNLNWAAGERWVGLTPISAFATQGQQFQGYTTPAVNDAGALQFSAIRNPGGGFAFPGGTGWINFPATNATTPPPNSYGAMDIVGTPVPEPASMAVLGVGALAMIRRRRSKKA